MTVELDCLVMALRGMDPVTLLRACDRAGAIGLAFAGVDRALEARLGLAGVARFGLVAEEAAAIEALAVDPPAGLSVLVLSAGLAHAASGAVAALHERGVRVLVEATGWEASLEALADRYDGFILKGHECAGLVGEQTTFILLQEFARHTDAPLYARGGITPETAAAAGLAGATGVVLDDQIVLMREAGLKDADLRRRIAALSGTETIQVEAPEGGRYLRGLAPMGSTLGAEVAAAALESPEALQGWATRLSWADGAVAPGGQGLVLAEPMRRRHGTLGRLIGAIRRAAATLPAAAAARGALARGGPLADSLGIDYPVLQGPMTRVSDVPDFALKVSQSGGLPFQALALLGGEQAADLLESTQEVMGGRPWGVGLLGFAPSGVLGPQLEAIERVRPGFAVVAGGRVNQMHWLEERGIHGFVHVATPALARHFLDEGITRFVAEGRECGGHIGPLSSFVLWAALIDEISRHPLAARSPGKIELVFAGGIHDALSAAMVATLAEPLASKGVRIGVLMGTAYLFTTEIVEAGAILPDYQDVALACTATQSLWEGPGFASRCAVTPITAEFRARKGALEAGGASVPEIREALEHYTLGRLRMATKGLARTGPDRALTQIGPEQRLAEGMYMIGQVASMHDTVVPIASLHETVCDGSVALLEERSEAGAVAAPAPAPCDIAIVGMATLLPGADTLETYWRRILGGECALRDVPADRWSALHYFDSDPSARDKVYARRGGFLEDVPFDPLKYGIPPAAIPSIDPMQMLALEVVGDALDDASAGAELAFDKERTSVVFGFSGGLGEAGLQYAVRSELGRLLGQVPAEILSRLPEWTEDSFAGLLPNVAAGRVANRYDFGGANFTVDAACGSSLAALYNAVLELESGRSDTVVAGGIDSLQSPFGYLCFSKTRALSPRGECNTFDAEGDGIVISEGLAAVVLKRLVDAERDGDRVYAVIKGVGASSDGRARGLTAPLPRGQRRALRRAYEQAGFAPSTIQLYEAHGTGTVAGDRAELETITEVLHEAKAAPRSVAIGSVKTLIGHTKAAAGVSGLIKVALGLHHKVLPPHAKVTTPNPVLTADGSPLYLSQKPRPWIVPEGQPRRAGVSAFGFGGTNFHVALEEYRNPCAPAVPVDPGLDLGLFAFAATDRAALLAAVKRLWADLEVGRFATLNAAARAVAGPWLGAHRLAFVAKSLDEATERLRAALVFLETGAAGPPAGLHHSFAPALMGGGKLAFLYSGQGSQYPDMLARTTLLDPAMVARLARADLLFAETPTGAAKELSLSRFIYPGCAFCAEDRKAQMEALTATEIAQPALGAIEAGLTDLLAGLGIRPDMVAGHSYGEIAALYAAGALSFDELIRLSEARGRAMVENGDPDKPGAMLAVAADRDATEAALSGLTEVVIANLNSPRQTVIAGTAAAIDKAAGLMDRAGLQTSRVPVSQAFHSPLMEKAGMAFSAALETVEWGTPACPVYSNVTTQPHATSAAELCAAMARHLVSPVDFVAMVRNMAQDGARVFVELGPKSVLSNRVPEILADGRVRAIALDRGSGDAASVFEALAELFVEGAPVDPGVLAARMAAPVPRPRPDAATTPQLWYLNGAYARRAADPRRDMTPPTVPVLAVPPGSAPEPQEELVFMEIKPNDPWPPASQPGGQGDILSDYHRMMAEFLRVQESVMLAYLGQGGARVPCPTMPVPAIASGPSAFPAPSVSAAPAPSPATVDDPPSPSVSSQSTPTGDDTELDKETVIARFLSVVAEKTGYPEDTLDPDQAMEADLGVDSIKRMEILGALQKVLPAGLAEPMRAEMDVIAQLPSIREIVEHVFSRMSDSTSAVATDVSGPFDLAGEAVKAADAVLPRYVQRPFHEPADHVPDDLPPDMPVIITESADGFHAVMAEALTGHGGPVLILPGAEFEAAQPARIADWLAGRGVGAAPVALIHCAGRGALPEPADFDAWAQAHRHGTKAFFSLLQVLAPNLREGGRVLSLSDRGGDFGRTTGPAETPMMAAPGNLGLVKALSLEWPGASLKAVDLDPAESQQAQASHVLRELTMRAGRREVGYCGGQRTILRTEPASLSPPVTRPVEPGPDWVIVATGGARGITAECLRPLAAFCPVLVLVGRASLPQPEPEALRGLDDAGLRAHFLAEARERGEKVKPTEIEARLRRHLADRDMAQNIRDLASLGARVDYRAADVSDPQAVETLFGELMRDHGRIDMVVHGAGLIEDRAFEKKTQDSFDRVFDTKVNAAWAVTRAAMNPALKAVAFFSSVAGRYGNPGQADYAAANETLNLYAWALKRGPLKHVRVKTINWGPWGMTTTGAGMVTEAVRRQFLSRGIGMVEAGPGREFFYKELFWSDADEVESIGWVADGESMESRVCALPPAPQAQVLGAPLVLLQGARKTAGGLGWRCDIVSAPYADHHRFDGVPVLPMAAAIQMMSELPGILGDPRTVVALEDVRLFNGVRLGEGAVELALSLSGDGAGGHVARITGQGARAKPHYGARLVMGQGLDRAKERPAPVAADWQGPDITEIYRRWLSHGPCFQTLDRVLEISETRARTLAHGTRPADLRAVEGAVAWTFDPALVDGMLQSVWIWARAIQDFSGLPLSAGVIRRHDGDPMNGPLLIETDIRDITTANNVHSDIRTFDASGALCYEIADFVVQCTTALNRLGGGWAGGLRDWDNSRPDAAE
ncbi:polyketide-type polyunsaturated fatty acid synthase PfaA [Rhodovulum bhavnagarense]|uniref:Polyketide-type polyunsaturated fatty acid synthase PfaA n=1 Tax=Rhodovulum bhavnagarense TaxID=992286 RepID=A0A4V2SWS5_9RHOB|nr:type I polyketide synthase [Rhodovulum bhavnagarense]TCP63426.1 polyketide-type polyunsaturated fatty acid synthase PfaA [Rhodovulum bhavnagarense]